MLITSQKQVNTALMELLKLLGMVITDTSPQHIQTLLQAKCLNPTLFEDRSLTDTEFAILQKLGMMDEVQSDPKEPKDVLLLGALQPWFKKRLHTLLKLLDNRVSNISTIYVLGNNRSLDVQKEDLAQHPDIQDEMDMLLHMLRETNIQKTLNIIPISTPNVGNRPANTGETIEEWHRQYPTKRPVLLISNQPFINYQLAVARRVLTGTSIVAVSSALPRDISLRIVLRTLAKQFHEEFQALL